MHETRFSDLSEVRQDIDLVKERAKAWKNREVYTESLSGDTEKLQVLLENPTTIIQRGVQRELVSTILNMEPGIQQELLIQQLRKDNNQESASLLLKAVVRAAKEGTVAQKERAAFVLLRMKASNPDGAMARELRSEITQLEQSQRLSDIAKFCEGKLKTVAEGKNTWSPKVNELDRVIEITLSELNAEAVTAVSVLQEMRSVAASQDASADLQRQVAYVLGVCKRRLPADHPAHVQVDAVLNTVHSVLPPEQAVATTALARIRETSSITEFVGVDPNKVSIDEFMEHLERSLAVDDELERSVRSFLHSILDLYKQRSGRGTIMYNIDMNFSEFSYGLDGQTLQFKLPEDRTQISFTTRGREGEKDSRLWHSTLMTYADGERSTSVYPARLDHHILGQKENGVWEYVGMFSDLLEEKPVDRILRITQEAWTERGVENDEQAKAEIAAEIFLVYAYLNPDTAYNFDEIFVGTLKALEKAEREARVTARENPEGFKALPQFENAVRVLATHMRHQEGNVLGGARSLLDRRGTMVLGYDIETPPLEKVKNEKGYKRVVEVSFADTDRFAGKAEERQLESGIPDPNDVIVIDTDADRVKQEPDSLPSGE